MRAGARIAAVVLWLMPGGGLTGPAPAGGEVAAETRCRQADVVVISEQAGDFGLECDAAAAAIGFLAGIGLEQSAPVKMNIVETLPFGFDQALGCYDWAGQEAFMLERESCIGDGGVVSAFGVPLDARLYASYVAHEVAHAVAAQAFGRVKPTVSTQEYIAAVVQLAVMEADLRRRVLEITPGDGFDADPEINLFAYQVDPGRFAVEAYRHFVRPENGEAFVARLMSGEVVLLDRLAF